MEFLGVVVLSVQVFKFVPLQVKNKRLKIDCKQSNDS